MKSVLIRRWSLIAGLIIILASYGINVTLTNSKGDIKKMEFSPPVPAVATTTVENSNIRARIPINGRLSAVQKIEIYPEVTGKLLSGNKEFKEGVFFRKGEVLLQMDSKDAYLNLISSRSSFHSTLILLLADLEYNFPENSTSWQTYISNFDPSENIKELPIVTNKQEKNFLVARSVYNQYYSIVSAEEQLSKFTLFAPFDGVVNQANINPNTVLRAGQFVGEFVNQSSYELEAGIKIEDREKISVGQRIKLYSSDGKTTWEGNLSRISKTVDQASQTVKAYIQISGKGLYDGMYLNGFINGDMIQNVTEVPEYLLIGESAIYLVNNDILERKEVKVKHKSEETVLVHGLKNGDLLLNQVLTGAKDGLKVKLSQ